MSQMGKTHQEVAQKGHGKVKKEKLLICPIPLQSAKELA
jgi:hypothetical protein